LGHQGGCGRQNERQFTEHTIHLEPNTKNKRTGVIFAHYFDPARRVPDDTL